MDVASSLPNNIFSCNGCGFSTKTPAVFRRHNKRCVFLKKMAASTISPKENYILGEDSNCQNLTLKSEEIEKPNNGTKVRSPRVTLGEKQFGESTQLNLPISTNPFEVYEFEPCISKVESLHVPKSRKSASKKNVAPKKTQKPFWMRPALVGAPPNRARKRHYKCKKCKFITNQSKEFLHHKMYIHNERIQVNACRLCEYACNSKHKLQRHWNLVHSSEGDPFVKQYSDIPRLELNQELSTLTNLLPTMPVLTADQVHIDPNLNKEKRKNRNIGPAEDMDLDKEVAEINSEPMSMFGWLKMPSQNPDPAASLEQNSTYGSELGDYQTAATFGDNNTDVYGMDYISEMQQSFEKYDFEKERNKFMGSNPNECVFAKTYGGIKPATTKKSRITKHPEFDYNIKPTYFETAVSGRKTKTSPCENMETEASVTKHIKVLPGLGKDPVYGCTLCRFTHPGRSKVLQHIRITHKKAQIFKCNICDFVCRRKSEWTSHKVTHSTKRIHACNECKYQTNFYRNYIRHMRHHVGKAGPVKCNYCTYSSTGEGAVQRHMREFHTDEEQNLQKEIMEDNSHGEAIGSVEMPVQTSEVPKNPFLYETVAKTPPNQPLRIEVTPSRSESPVICGECGMACKSQAHLSRHKIVHSSEQPFPCASCGLKYKRLSDLNRHCRKKHPSALSDLGAAYNMTTDGIDDNYESGNDFILHEGSVEMPRTPEHILDSVNIAEQNEPGEPLNLSVKKMEDSDSDEGNEGMLMPFQLLSNDSLLAINRNNNIDTVKSALFENNSSLVCPDCPYMGKCPSDFKRHLLSHTEHKPFKCTLCDRGFKHKGDLNKHSRDKHGLQVGKPRRPALSLLHQSNPWACLFCSFRCKVRDDIRDHLQAKHEESVIQYGHLGHLVDQTYSLVADEKLKPVVMDGKVCCPYCSYQTDAPSKIKTHIEIHGNLKRYMCPDCGRRSNWIWDIRKHIRKEHPFSALDVVQLSEEEAKSTLPHYLAAIGKTRSSPGLLSPRESPSMTQHMSDSGSSFSESPLPSQSALRKMSPHERIRPFKCSACGRRSNWKYDMQKHLNICPGGEMIVLDPQEAKATLSECLASPPPIRKNKIKGVGVTKHINTPSRDTTYIKKLVADKNRPFKCSVCGKRSNWRWDLKKHIRNTHPGGQVITLTEEEAKASDQFNVKKPVKTAKPNLQVKWNLFDRFRKIKPAPPIVSQASFQGDISAKVPSSTRTQQNHIASKNQISPSHESSSAGRSSLSPEQNNNTTLDSKSKKVVQSLHKASPNKPTSVDNKRLKRFKCSVCYYRSNFKGDIKRHVENFHEGVVGARVLFMSEEEAAETLSKYNTEFLGRRRGPKPKLKKRKRPHTVPTPLSGVDLFKVVRSCTPDIALMSGSYPGTDDDMSGTPSMEDSQPSVSSLAEMNGDDTGPIEVPRPASVASGPQRKNYYKCNQCDVWTTARKYMDDHTRIHTRGSKYQCALCGDKSDYQNSIIRHLRMRHKVAEMQEIQRLTNVTSTYTVLDEQPEGTSLMQTVQGEFMDEPLQVKTEPIDEDDMTDQMATPPPQPTPVHNGSGNTINFIVSMFECKICGSAKTSAHKYSITRHIHKHHPEITNPDDYIKHCRTQAQRTIGEYKPHTPKVVGEVRNTVGLPGYHCKICPFSTSKKPRLTLHATYHKPQPGHKYKCRHCPYFVNHPRLLHSHIRLHLQQQGLIPQEEVNPSEFPAAEDQPSALQKFLNQNGSVVNPKKSPSKNGRSAFQCTACPYVTFNKNDYLYHKQFHRPKPAAQFKCDLCPYWITEKRLLGLHMKVHNANYRSGRFSGKQASNKKSPLLAQPSPVKSDISELSLDDAVEIAYVKQQIIASKIKSVAVTPMKVRPDPLYSTDGDIMPSFILDKQIMVAGSYKKYHQCRYCPWTNVRTRNLKLHEAMHGADSKRPHKCPFCDYHVGNRGLLSHHIKVHSAQYRPGQDVVNDVEEEVNTDSDQPETDLSKEGILFKVDEKETKERVVEQEGEKLETQALPDKSKFYLKYSDSARAHVLERSVQRKWCCEKCPYATLKKQQFENHVLLHGCKQQFTCQYCDYSVPTYHFLIQHEKIHHMPNPNLLNIQSISNLMRLPDIPADLAAAAAGEDEPGHHDGMTTLYENCSQFSEPKKLYRCDRCPYSNVRREPLLSHLRYHMIRSDFRCKYCDYSVTKGHLLGQHVKLHFNLPGTELNSQSPSKDDKWEVPIVDNNNDEQKCEENGLNEKKNDDAKKDDASTETMDIESNESKTKVAEKKRVGRKSGKANGRKESKMDVSDDKTDGNDDNKKPEITEQNNNPVDGSCETFICQYCDRAFHSSPKHNQHERLHLMGTVH